MPVADDSEGLAADLPAAFGDFVPDGGDAEFDGTVDELAREGDDFADDELGDGAGVGKGGVEDGDADAGGGVEVDLVGADTEATYNQELRRSLLLVSDVEVERFRHTLRAARITLSVILVLLRIPMALYVGMILTSSSSLIAFLW